MGNKYVKWTGIAVDVVGVVLAVIAISLMEYREVERTIIGYTVSQPYEDLGRSLYSLSLAAIVIGVVLIIAGFVLQPSFREVRLARRLADRNWARLQEHERDVGGGKEGV